MVPEEKMDLLWFGWLFLSLAPAPMSLASLPTLEFLGEPWIFKISALKFELT